MNRLNCLNALELYRLKLYLQQDLTDDHLLASTQCTRQFEIVSGRLMMKELLIIKKMRCEEIYMFLSLDSLRFLLLEVQSEFLE